jgi:hypothetical protein
MMKDIISPKSSDWRTGDLKAKLRELTLEHHPDVADLEIEEFQIREAWALSRDCVKVSCELKLRSGHYRGVTRTDSAISSSTKTAPPAANRPGTGESQDT